VFQRFLLFLALLPVAGCVWQESSGNEDAPANAHTVVAVLETPPVDSSGDAADDPAIWVHPTDPLLSLVIGTDKDRGLHVYDLEGQLLQSLPDGRMNNVDLRDDFMLGGLAVTVVAASNRSNESIAFYLLNPATRRLTSAGTAVPTGLGDPDGLCMYRSAVTGAYFVFIADSGAGAFQQWRLSDDGGQLGATLVREFDVGHAAEGCAADDELGNLFVAEEGGALWRYSAEPAGGSTRTEIDRVNGPNGLRADLEGITIWYGAGSSGYLVLSNQGASNFAVYRREGANAFVGIFHIVADAANGVDGVSDTDGIDVTSRPLGPQFPNGLLVVQDGLNLDPREHQDFKYVSWQVIVDELELTAGP
jgi:3-phytase